MSELPKRSQQLIDATPIVPVRTGVRTIVELTAYPDGHANIAVGSLDTSVRGAMRYERADSLPLNHRAELEVFVEAILDRRSTLRNGEAESTLKSSDFALSLPPAPPGRRRAPSTPGSPPRRLIAATVSTRLTAATRAA